MHKFLHHCIVLYSPGTCWAGTLWHWAVEYDIVGSTMPQRLRSNWDRICNHLCAMLWIHFEECQVVKISHRPICCFAAFSVAKFSRPPLDAAVSVGFHPTVIVIWQALSSTDSVFDVFKCTASKSWHGKWIPLPHTHMRCSKRCSTAFSFCPTLIQESWLRGFAEGHL